MRKSVWFSFSWSLKTKHYANIHEHRIIWNVYLACFGNEQTYSWKYSLPRYDRPRGIFVMIARDFQNISKLEDTRFYVGGFLYWKLIEVYKITFRNSVV